MIAATQLSLYDDPPSAAPPVIVFSNKQPWEMSEAEYDAFDEALPFYERVSVPARDNPFQQVLYGQEAHVFLALQEANDVPAEVLGRFEELQEWHETGSSPTIRENEERARKRQEEIDNRPPIGTEERCREDRREGSRVIYVEPARLQRTFEPDKRRTADIASSYSADLISNPRSTVRRPFVFEGKRYVSTGTGPLTDSVEAYQLVAEAEFDGEVTTYADKVHQVHNGRNDQSYGEAARNDPFGFYHRMQVTSAGKPHVLVGPPIILRPGKEGTAPAGTLFKPGGSQ
jgi:hypothetical protein